jgi:hypothetical protein
MAEFTATFNPNPDPPAAYPFSLTTAAGPVSNLILVEEGATEISISITLAAGASFPATGSPVPQIVWSLGPDVETDPVLIGDTLTFTVPAPTHVLHPWIFRFVANVAVDGFPDITGVRSQSIYVAKTFSGSPFILKYAPDNGDFSLVDSLDSNQDGAILGAELVMVNTQLGEVTVNLESDPAPASAPIFATEPIYWSGTQPGWITLLPPPSPDGTSLAFSIDPAAAGQSVGLQFAIVLNAGTPGSTTILSPDPILINATIGD